MTKALTVGDRVAGRYEIRSVVGSGPFGTVYAAHDADIEVTVALKVFSDAAILGAGERRRAVDALRLARKISQKNLNRVFDVGEDADNVFVASQFIEGVSLERALAMRAEKAERFSPREADALVSQLVAALEVVHRTTFHGNLKPTNVLVLPDTIKITDLYLREAVDGARFESAAGPFHAPEVREGRGDTRADLFSLGAIAFELLVGRWDDACARGEAAERAAAAGASTRLVDFFARAVAVNPADRFVAPEEFLGAFRDAAGLVSTRETSRSEGQPPQKLVVPNTGEHVEADASTARQPSLEFPAVDARAQPSEKRALPSSPAAPPPLPGRKEDSPPLTIPDARVPVRQPALRAAKSAGATPTPPVGEAVLGPSARDWPAGFAFRWALLAVVFVAGTAGSLVAIDRIDGEIARLRRQPVRDAGDGVPPPPAVDLTKRGADLRVGAPIDGGRPRVVLPVDPTSQRVDAGGTVARGDARREAASTRETRDSERRGVREARAAREAAPERDPKPPKGKCAKGMVLVKGGKTPVGSAANDPLRAFGDRTFEWVKVDDYCVDVFEYPGYRGAMAATRVSFAEAQGICERGGKRLCSEDEWERACNGGKKNRFPYGDEFDADKCNSADATSAPRKAAPVGEFKACRSPSGAVDMSGNVAEWTAAAAGIGAKVGAVRGGSSLRPDYGVRCASRLRRPASERSAEIGFRCCATP